jgi:integrase
MSQQQESAGSSRSTDIDRQTSKIATQPGGFRPSVALPASTLPELPLRAGSTPVAQVIDWYMAYYDGRDSTRVQRLSWWSVQLGHVPLQDLTDDDVFAAIEGLARQHARYFAGKDADGRPIHRAKRKALAPATLNRYQQALAAVMTWAIKKRIAPKGYVHPCRSVERRAENNEKTRFLTDEERMRLLDACKASSWPRLYALVLMALTTGARKGELLGLKWGDIEFTDEHESLGGLATIARTKNGDPRVLPLTKPVAAELQRFKGAATSHVFVSPLRKDRAYSFEPKYLEALQAARIRGVTFHTLRHSCASALAKNGATLLEIGDVLGHRQMQMTKRYSHLATGHKAALVNRVLGDVK